MPTLLEIEELLQSPVENRPLTSVRIGVLRNVTLDPLVPYLRYYGRTADLDVQVRFGEYDQVVQEANGAGTVWDDPLDVVVVHLWLRQLSPRLALQFAAFSEAELDEEVERVKATFEAVIRGLRRQTAAPIVWFGIELPTAAPLGVLDRTRRRGSANVVEELNRFAVEILRDVGNGFYLDVGACLARVGVKDFYDWRYWHAGRAPFARKGLDELAAETLKIVRALRGKTKKCLVLDCDNVLWGGILGEDGVDGVKLGPDQSGSAYFEFQQAALNLYHRGVILAICSKNNEADVWECIERRGRGVLQRRHFAAWRINWNDKATNLRELAAELNIGLDSFVFVDDSPFEIDLVRHELPEVTSLHMPPARASEAAQVLASCGLFDAATWSEEDRSRGEMYRAEAERRQSRVAAGSLHDYLVGLEMKVSVAAVDKSTLSRALQLTQRTNQFNLTTRRYGEGELERLAASPIHDVATLQLSDRFGDYGVVGLVVMEYEGSVARIDALMLSCRVLGRGVETALLRLCHDRARQRGAAVTYGTYRPSAKNGQTASYYAKHGFMEIRRTADEVGFELSAENAILETAEHFKTVDCRWE